MKGNILLLFLGTLFSLFVKGQDLLVVDTSAGIEMLTDLPSEDFYLEDTVEIRNFREGFQEKYGSDDFDYKEQNKEKGALAKFLERLFRNADDSTVGGVAIFFIWLIRIIILLCILYAVYVLVNVIMGKEGAWFFSKKSDAKSLTYGISEEDISGTNYNELIESAVSNGDFRSAVRYYYLLTLQKLSGKGHIDFHKDKTNTDYGYEIKDKKLAYAFGYVSYIYDHAWYGAFDMTDRDYHKASVAFDDTIKMI